MDRAQGLASGVPGDDDVVADRAGVQSGGRISIGTPDSSSARSSAPGRMTSWARLSGPGAIIKSTQWLKRSPSPGFSADTKTAAGAACRVASANIR